MMMMRSSTSTMSALVLLCFVVAFVTLTSSSSITTVHALDYLGCYRDAFPASERDLIGSLVLNDDKQNFITPEYCDEYCGMRSFKYVGVQYGSECWCGNSYGKHGKLDDKECNVACVGKSINAALPNHCGGSLANSIYKITIDYPKISTQKTDGRPLLGLVMIVKDEAHTLPNTLAPLAPYIDSYHILDTGSKDGTQDAIRKVLGKEKGTIYEEPFIDYGRSRNRALELAQTAENPPIFSLMLSADETVHHPEALKAFCEEFRNAEGAMHEAYPIQMDVGWKFDSMRLSRTDKGWRYVGRVHEYLAAPDQKWRPSIRVPQAYIQFRVTDPERRGKREYVIRDILLEEVKEKPHDTRASFYLARTYNVIGNHTGAIKEFKRRIALGGWQEEVYESYYAIAFQLEAIGEPWSVVHEAFLEAHNHSPERGEPLFNIAQHYWNTPDHKALAYPYAAHCLTLPYPKEAVLWVQADVYNYQCAMYVALSGILDKVRHYYDGYVGLLKALKVQSGDWQLQKLKPEYEAKLSVEERTKAQCAAGVKTGVECVGQGAKPVPCIKTDDPAPTDAASDTTRISVLDNINKEPAAGEQSNILQKEADIGSIHVPEKLKDKYSVNNLVAVSSTTPSSVSDSSRYILLGFFGGLFLVGLIYFVLKQFHFTNWIALKLFGGKTPAGARGGSSGGLLGGGKFV